MKNIYLVIISMVILVIAAFYAGYETKSSTNNAKQQVYCALHSDKPVEWPEIADQRDQLSDAIRNFYDHDSIAGKQLEEFVKLYSGRNIDQIKCWAYAY